MIENFELNKEIFFWINDLAGQNEILDWIFVFFAEYLLYILIILFLVYFGKQILRDKKIEIKEFLIFFSASFGSWILTKIIKFIIKAERPFSYFDLNNTLLTHYNVFQSFPSGHSTLAFALATSVWIYNKRIGASFFIIAFLIAMGRILVGVHFPLDVITGSLIGILSVLSIGLILKKKFNK